MISADDRLTLAARIERACQRSGLSKREIAKRMGASPGAVAHWARGDHLPSSEQLAAFARVTGADGHWLLTGEGGEMRGEKPNLESVLGSADGGGRWDRQTVAAARGLDEDLSIEAWPAQLDRLERALRPILKRKR